MKSKNSRSMTDLEADHVASVKELPCSVCDEPGPSDAHHINQGDHFTVVALCKSCHQGAINGWHGQKRMWILRKLDELGALNITLRRQAERMRSCVRRFAR